MARRATSEGKGTNGSPVRPQGAAPVDSSIASGLNWLPALSLAISILSFGISGATFYSSNVAPFAPAIVVGPLVWQPRDSAGRFPDNERPTSEPFTDAEILAPVTFTHGGGRPGVVEDVVLILRPRLSKAEPLRFEPELVLDEQAYLLDLNPRNAQKWVKSRFMAIPLARGQQEQRFILFLRQSGAVAAGEFTLETWIRKGGKFELAASRSEALPQGVWSEITRGTRWSQTPQSVIDARRGLK